MNELQQVFRDILNRRMTGRVMLVGTSDGATISARLTLREGRLTQVNLGNLVGLTAFKRLLNATIKHVSMVESQAVEATVDDSLPTLESVLAELEKTRPAALGPGAKILNATTSDAILDLATKAFEEVYGAKAKDKLADVVQRFPPDENPREFIATCRAQIEMLLGPGKADQLVQPIFDLLQRR